MTSVTRPEFIQRMGGTPLVELSTYSTSNVRIFAKLEWYNPFGSVKDRPSTLDDPGGREKRCD